MVLISVKWNSNNYDNLEILLSDPLDSLRKKLWELTGVLPERQKIMSNKGIIKNDADLKRINLQDGSKIMLIGTSENKGLKVPTEKVIFFEDLPPEERGKLMNENNSEILPVGLTNLGNTCYLNSIIQLFRYIPCFREELLETCKLISNKSSLENKFILDLNDLMKELDISTTSVVPTQLVNKFRKLFPQYAVISRSFGQYQQQDADEVLGSLISLFNSGITGKGLDGIIFSNLFKFSVKSKLINTTLIDEQEEVKIEDNYKLLCHMGTQLKPIDNLSDGIKLSLDELIEKHSSTLNSNSIYNKISQLDSLPNYLLVQLVRFEWKKSSEIARTEATRAKVCRRVSFTQIFDLFEFCTPELQSTLLIGRKIMEKRNSNLNKSKENKEDKEADQCENLVECPTGFFDLQFIISHQGRTADGGHYVAWRQCEDKEHLIKFDDDKVTKVKNKDSDLSGGRSDYHIAVLLLFKSNVIYATEEEINSLE